MLPLPVPQAGGSIDALASFLNLRDRNDFVLVVAWLLSTLRASGPYPLLAISGEQGSAKTVLSKLLKAVIDPNVAPVRALVREERDLVIAANNSYVLAFDLLIISVVVSRILHYGLNYVTPGFWSFCSKSPSAKFRFMTRNLQRGA